MIVVVADTSPLNYLVPIHCQHPLPALYERVFVPAAVVKELSHSGTPAIVRVWLRQIPAGVREVQSPPDPALGRLGQGEGDAIQLAREEGAPLLLMDEKLGVRLARLQGLTVTGTLGVLMQAARPGLVDLDSAVAALQATGFRCSPKIFEQAKQRAREEDGQA